MVRYQRATLAVAVVAAALWLPPATGAEPRHDAPNRCEHYCLSVTPTSGVAGETVFTITGRRWRPHLPVEALYGTGCAPTPGKPLVACLAVLLARELRANRNGTFELRYVVGGLCCGPAAGILARFVAHGSGVVHFEQQGHTAGVRRGVFIPTKDAAP
jgi:hypothetical protein